MECRRGYLSDLLLVDGIMYRSRGIVQTIKDSVVTENARSMEEVAQMVAESHQGAEPLLTQVPFI